MTCPLITLATLETGEALVYCKECGMKTHMLQDAVASYQCSGRKPLPAEQALRMAHKRAFLLGDFIENNLKAIGITQDRWKAAKEFVGLSPDCNCRERREALNRFGERFGRTARRRLDELMRRENRNGKL